MFILPLFLIILIVWFFTSPMRRERIAHYFNDRRNPLEIAKERYARGEITRDQYDQMNRDLS